MPLLISSNSNQNQGGGGPPFTFTQLIESNLWIVNHNLGYYPDVRVYTPTNELVECDVQQTSINQTILTFTEPFVGFANLI